MGCFPRIGDQTKEFISVDYASDVIFHLSRRPECLNGNYHITPPSMGQSVPFDAFFRLVAENGYPMQEVPYAVWKALLCEFVKHEAGRVLMPLVPMLTERVHDGTLTRWELYQNRMNYHCANTNRGLAGAAIHYPQMDSTLIRTYLSYLERAALLSSVGGTALSASDGAGPALRAASAATES
jgi:hypothetical protein